MSDDGQMLSILHSNGQTYIELGKEGTIDLYATNSVNVRTQGDLNLHADNDLNLHAGRNVNVKATQNMFVDADNNYSQRVGNDHTSYALNNMSFKSDNAIGLLSANQLGIESGMEILENAPKIHMNGPSASLIPGIVEPIEVKQHPDTLFDKAVGWATALAQIDSITTRAPAHMPWQYANQGVDVTVESGADEALPATPDADISAINKAASEAGDAGGAAPGVTPATSASVPEVGAISGAIDKNATTSVLGGIATAAAMSDNLGGAVSKGTDIVTSAAGVATAAVGSFAQTPSQLSSGGVLKPGADTMVNTLVSAGKSVKQAMPKSAFSGKNGASNLDTLVGSTSTQAKSVVTNLQKGQTALTKIGAVTGKEASTAIGGIVAGTGSQMVGSLTGAGGLADTVSSTASALSGGGSGLGTVAGGGADLLGSVTQGAKSTLASTLTGGTGGITKALDALNKAPDGFNITAGFDADIGASASSFKSITATFKKMPANVPVDLEALAKEAAASVTAAAEGVTGTDLASFSVDTSIADNAISDATSAVSALTGSPTNLANAGGLSSAASIVSTGASASTAAVVASGMSGIPGGQKIGGSLVDNAKGSVNAIADGLGSLSSEVGSIASDAFSGGDPGAGIKDLLGDASSKLDGITDTLSGSLSPGASAALVSALASLTSGGGSTVTLPTVALNTFGTRESLMGLVNQVLGNPKVPRPNLLGKIPSAALGAFASLKALTKKLKTAQKAVASQEKQIAAKQASYAELVTSLPAGSPEIAEAKAQYEAALNSPAYTAAKAEVKAVAEEIKQSTAPTVVDSSLNQFQDLENLINTTADNQSAQVLNNQSTSNVTQAGITPGLSQTVNILDDGLNTYSVIEAGEGQPVIPGAEEVVENTVEAVTGQVTDPTPPTDGAGSMGGFLQGDFGLGGNSGGGGEGGAGSTNWKWDQTLSQWKLK